MEGFDTDDTQSDLFVGIVYLVFCRWSRHPGWGRAASATPKAAVIGCYKSWCHGGGLVVIGTVVVSTTSCQLVAGYRTRELLPGSRRVCCSPFLIVSTKVVEKLLAPFESSCVLRASVVISVIGGAATQTASVADGKVADKVSAIGDNGSGVLEPIWLGDGWWAIIV